MFDLFRKNKSTLKELCLKRKYLRKENYFLGVTLFLEALIFKTQYILLKEKKIFKSLAKQASKQTNHYKEIEYYST